jgi:hypothetical protein
MRYFFFGQAENRTGGTHVLNSRTLPLSQQAPTTRNQELVVDSFYFDDTCKDRFLLMTSIYFFVDRRGRWQSRDIRVIRHRGRGIACGIRGIH